MRWLRKLVPEERFVTAASSLLAMTKLARAGQGIVLGTIALLATTIAGSSACCHGRVRHHVCSPRTSTCDGIPTCRS